MSYKCILISSVVLLAACSDKEPVFQEQPVEVLYQTGYSELRRGNMLKAASAFNATEQQHPHSELAPSARLLAAYSYYLAKKYDEAVECFRIFIQLHPDHKDIAYAYYMLGMCWYEQVPVMQRDQIPTKEALKAFAELIERFPLSVYTKDARAKKDFLNGHLAAHEMDVGRFYQSKKSYVAAINRFQNVVDFYQTSSQAPEALHRLVECHLAIGLLDQAKVYAAVLGHNHPRSSWYEASYKLFK